MTRGIGWRDAAGAAFRVLPPASFESDWISTGHDGGLREMRAKANGLSGACLSRGGAKQSGAGPRALTVERTAFARSGRGDLYILRRVPEREQSVLVLPRRGGVF